MTKNLKKFFVRSLIILLFIHLVYFIYGFFKFEGIRNINIYFEFYRFKFYDDVSISHFFVSGLFLLFFLIILIRKHAGQQYSARRLMKIGLVLLLVSFLSFSFFVSYSFGLNAKMRAELPEANFNKDKELLNVLNPFLYNYTSYSSEKLFNVTNILYPKPYPVIEEIDSTLISENNYITESTYYSIDTLKVLTSDLDKITKNGISVLDRINIDPAFIKDRIIAKNSIKDSTQIIFKGMEVNPKYDDGICIFLQNKNLYKPVHKVSVEKQEFDAAVKRYKLLYKYNKDSLIFSFKRMDTLLKKYNIENYFDSKKLIADVYYYKKNNDKIVGGIANDFDKKALREKINTIDKLFYKPNYLDRSIRTIFFVVIISVWVILFLIYILLNNKKKTAPEN